MEHTYYDFPQDRKGALTVSVTATTDVSLVTWNCFVM